MKTLLVAVSIMLIIPAVTFAGGEKYRINDDQIESLFAGAEEISVFDMYSETTSSDIDMFVSPVEVSGQPTPEVAFFLSFCLGGLGIHRLYLGTEPIVFVVYLVSGLIGYTTAIWVHPVFGLVAVFNTVLWVVDTILLGVGWLSYDDISKYVDNPSLIMW